MSDALDKRLWAEQLKRVQDSRYRQYERCENLESQLTIAQERIARLEAALKEYGDESKWGCSGCYDGDINCEPPHSADVWRGSEGAGYEIAQTALRQRIGV